MTVSSPETDLMTLVPLRISEVVLKTQRFEEMKGWYTRVVGVAPFFERTPPPGQDLSGLGRASDRRIAFIRLHLDHPYAQVLGLFEVPEVTGEPKIEPGLDHMQLRNASLAELVRRFELLKALGQHPFRTANHGPGTSFYYKDPDGNRVELSASNFDTEAEYLAYFQSESYRRNPSGIEIDVEDFVARFRAGTPRRELVAID
ncbi:VOC family protein [Phenylobacterium sp. VNQ135]|uniref:VOC family protein n=1 Tax=Phenylobacterium sp. VNQ135 TaxID=3400922 RepID=UPI003BFBE571